jgi:hypothetical protein
MRNPMTTGPRLRAMISIFIWVLGTAAGTLQNP